VRRDLFEAMKQVAETGKTEADPEGCSIRPSDGTCQIDPSCRLLEYQFAWISRAFLSPVRA
jgi:hypothetical protein